MSLLSLFGAHKSTTQHTRAPIPSGGGDVETTAAAANTTKAIDEGADESSSKTSKGGQEGNDNDNDGDNTLWEQMTAREGREAARRAGMSVGDWQSLCSYT